MKLCLVLIGVLSTAMWPVSAHAEPAWREAFQSSPGSLAGMPDETIRLLIKRLKLPPALSDQLEPRQVTGTIRYRITVAAAGTKIRVRLSNEEGLGALRLSGASVALAGSGFDAAPRSLRPLTFGGRSTIVVPPGAPVISDPVDLAVCHGSELLVSIATPDEIKLQPMVGGILGLAKGNQVREASLGGASLLAGRPFVTGVTVFTNDPPHIIVAMGDSITDGVRATASGIHSWPEQLDRRLHSRKVGGRYSVINAGIGGNRLLSPGMGASALARLDRDVFRVEGVTHLILLEGTNDLAMSGNPLFGDNSPLNSKASANHRPSSSEGYQGDTRNNNSESWIKGLYA